MNELPARIEDNIAYEPMSGCWLWTGTIGKNGHGDLSWKGKNTRPHRAVYEILTGTIPKGLNLYHRCSTKLCVNPDHQLIHQKIHAKGVLPEYINNRISRSKSGCWIWTGGRSGRYGSINFDGIVKKAHAQVYEILNGSIPKGNHLHHTCRTSLCVNPDHLQSLTPFQHKQKHRLTHCKHGHEFTPENTYIRIDGGGRQCKTCHRNRQRKEGIK